MIWRFRLFVTFSLGEDRLHLKNENKTYFILHFARFALSLPSKTKTMTPHNDTYPTSSRPSNYLIGGGNSLIIRELRYASRFAIFLLFLMVSFLHTSCEKETPVYAGLKDFYTESQYLGEQTADSLHRFQLKLAEYVLAYPEATDQPLYHDIQANIRDALLTIQITIDTTWGDDRYIYF